MRPSRVRLTVTALLFLGWVGFLIYLSATTGVLPWSSHRPVVLSRPQFLAAKAYVIADLIADLQRGPGEEDAPAAKAVVRKAVWAAPGVDPGTGEILVFNLPRCGRGEGWSGPGAYILALDPVSVAVPVPVRISTSCSLVVPLPPRTVPVPLLYTVTQVPRSPGYRPHNESRSPALVPAPIYLATEQARRELSDLKAEFH
jgi:hypothetical protein